MANCYKIVKTSPQHLTQVMAALRSSIFSYHLKQIIPRKVSFVQMCRRQALLSLRLRQRTKARAIQLKVSSQCIQNQLTRRMNCSPSQMMTQTFLGTSPSIMISQSKTKDLCSSRNFHPRSPIVHCLFLRLKTIDKRPCLIIGVFSSSQWAQIPYFKVAKLKTTATATKSSRTQSLRICPQKRQIR